MQLGRLLVSIAASACVTSSAAAIEGPSAAGPIGGTDIRSAMLPPPGIYLGTVAWAGKVHEFLGPDGKEIAALSSARLGKQIAAPFFVFVPETKVWGGAIGFGGVLPAGNQCGTFVSTVREHCSTGLGDAYLEVDWQRFFGTVRPSRSPNAYPILEGLSVLLGFGVVLPTGQFDYSTRLEQTISIGNNIWDFAPSFALTYTTAPILAEGTELSFKVFWNNYLENAATSYRSGDLWNIDFALTEHIGPFQVGLAGFFAAQSEDDTRNGVRAEPGGNRGMALQLGGVVNYDIPTEAASIRLKANTTADARNTVGFSSIMLGFIKKY